MKDRKIIKLEHVDKRYIKIVSARTYSEMGRVEEEAAGSSEQRKWAEWAWTV